MKKLKTYLVLLGLLLISCLKSNGQTLTYQFIDPCTKVVTFFSVPATGTTVFFLGKSSQFTSADIASGAFATWVNQAYVDYRKVTPCSQQSGQVTQNQITSQIIGNTVQSVVGSIMSQAQSAASGTMQSVTTSASTSNASSAGGNLNASKNNKDGDKKPNQNGNNNNNNVPNASNNNNSNGSNTNVPGTNQSGNNSSGSNNGTGTGNGNNTSTGGSNNSGSNQGGSPSTNNSNTQSSQNNKTEGKGEEVATTTTMNVDQQNQNSSKDDNSGGGGGKGGKNGGKSGTTNPLIVSSDFTTAQNLDKSFTPILNLSMNQSSMTGMSSWGLTSMIWFNFKQFALSGKYTKINFSKNGKLKWVHNINLTAVYSYGNLIGFVGYSGILNAGKWGVTGFNTSAAMTLITGEQKNTFISPSITAFYTKPFKANKRLTVSPELYIISTPLIYSTVEKVTTTDRTFSAFIGSGFDYQITKRFKFNMNYKANLSTNPDFPILSFFLIGSKINL